LNALIRKEVKLLKGSGGRRSSESGRTEKLQRAFREEGAGAGCKPGSGLEREADRAVETSGGERSSRPGALTLEW
jgi:hypothetical protein